MQLGKIEMKIKKNLILLFNFFIHLLTDNSFATYRLCDFWYSAQKKNQKIYEKKRASRLERDRFGRILDFHMSQRPCGQNIFSM